MDACILYERKYFIKTLAYPKGNEIISKLFGEKMNKKSLLIGFIGGIIVTIIAVYGAFYGTSTVSDNTSSENLERKSAMKIKLASVFVDDQQKALEFYTEILGFIKKHDLPVGKFRWITVVSPDGPNDIELVLEPNDNPAARTFQKAIYDQGIPATAFFVDDIQKEYERINTLGVEFTMEPTETGSVTIAIFDDTCGNLIQIVQE
jgi:predicted enzyme related to lactoylglutathione lyase